MRPSEKLGQELGPERPDLKALLLGLEVCMARDICLVCGERAMKGGWVEAGVDLKSIRWAMDKPGWVRCMENNFSCNQVYRGVLFILSIH